MPVSSQLPEDPSYDVEQEGSDLEYRPSSPKYESEDDRPVVVFTNTRDTAIEILDSSPPPQAIAGQHRTTPSSRSSSPLLPLEEALAKYFQDKSKPQARVKAEPSPEPGAEPTPYDIWDHIPRQEKRQILNSSPVPQTSISTPLTPVAPIARPRKHSLIPHAMSIAGSAQVSASEASRKEKARPNAGSTALSYRTNPILGQKPRFGAKEMVSVVLIQCWGHYALKADQEATPPYLTITSHRILSKPFIPSLYRTMLISPLY
jgi:hypothetical protein